MSNLSTGFSTGPRDPALLALTREEAPVRRLPQNYVLLKFANGLSEAQRQKIWHMVRSRFDWAVRASDKIRISGVTLAEALTLNTLFGHWCQLEAHVAT